MKGQLEKKRKKGKKNSGGETLLEQVGGTVRKTTRAGQPGCPALRMERESPRTEMELAEGIRH